MDQIRYIGTRADLLLISMTAHTEYCNTTTQLKRRSVSFRTISKIYNQIYITETANSGNDRKVTLQCKMQEWLKDHVRQTASHSTTPSTRLFKC